MMHQSGLTKLVEECGELIQVAAKRMSYPKGDHPDGAGCLEERMEDEMGDVLAAIYFTARETGLNIDRIEERKTEKLYQYNIWNEEV
jgi:NTP pyrophosphatase (non-canonical NTP hydrolase)